MTGQTLLDTCEVLNQELQLQSGEVDVVRALRALNIAQDFFEAQLGGYPNVCGSGSGTITATANTETTAVPTGLIRLDTLTLLDANSRPRYDLIPDKNARIGANRRWWMLSGTFASSPGALRSYYTNGNNIFWRPIPSTTQSVRWHGLTPAADITAGGTFAYNDIAALPIASFAVHLLAMGVADSVQDLTSLASAVFTPVIKTLAGLNQAGADGLVYDYNHTT